MYKTGALVIIGMSQHVFLVLYSFAYGIFAFIRPGETNEIVNILPEPITGTEVIEGLNGNVYGVLLLKLDN